jgi:hypothetical protein
MIVFKGTKKIGHKSFLIFGNDNNSVIDIPVEEGVKNQFLLYFQRLEPVHKTSIEKSAT